MIAILEYTQYLLITRVAHFSITDKFRFLYASKFAVGACLPSGSSPQKSDEDTTTGHWVDMGISNKLVLFWEVSFRIARIICLNLQLKFH